eukprot:3222536-Pyramimonas_sp.AAC.1
MTEAKAKANAKHKSNPCEDPAAAEPKYATYEEASAAAQPCTKCPPCKDGSKGSRACVGVFRSPAHAGLLGQIGQGHF